MRQKPILSLPALFVLGACSVVGPIVDRDMSDAPHRVCAKLSPPPGDPSPTCFDILTRDAQGQIIPLESDALRAGDRIYAMRLNDAACQGRFDHLVVTGDTSGPGRMRVSVADAVGRGDVSETFAWRRARAERRWTVDDIDAPLHIAGTTRIEMLEGEMRLISLCAAGYGG